MSARHVAVSISPVAGRPLAVWKFLTAVTVPLPKTPSTAIGCPAAWRCSCAQRTRSRLPGPRASSAQSVAGGTPVNAVSGWPIAFQFAEDAASHDHQLTPGEPCTAAIWRKRATSEELVLL